MKTSIYTLLAGIAALGLGNAQENLTAAKGAEMDDAGHVRIPLQVTTGIKAVYQVSDDVLRDEKAKVLLYAKKLLDVYNKNGVADDEVDLHLVFHGAAIKALVDDATRERLKSAGEKENPNRELLAELLKRGVQVELCESTMEQNEVASKDLLEGVTTVVGAFPRLIELQTLGYVYIKFE